MKYYKVILSLLLVIFTIVSRGIASITTFEYGHKDYV